jgi:hypothetical protein
MNPNNIKTRIINGDNRWWLGHLQGKLCEHNLCKNLAIGYHNLPSGGNPKCVCKEHAPQEIFLVPPNTLKTWDVINKINPRYPRHYIVARYPLKPVEYPEHDMWSYAFEGDWYSRWECECATHNDEQIYESEYTVLRYVLSKYSNDWNPEEVIIKGFHYLLCPNCLQIITPSDTQYVSEYRGECWGAPAYESMPDSFICPLCGFEGEY